MVVTTANSAALPANRSEQATNALRALTLAGSPSHTPELKTCIAAMPPKVRDLIAQLEQAGFTDRGGKGSHRNFVHPKVSRPVTISGAMADDARHYQIRAVRVAIAEAKR